MNGDSVPLKAEPAADRRGPGRPRKDARASLKSAAEAFHAALVSLDPVEAQTINRELNGNYGITLAELREHVAAFTKAV